MLHHSEKVTPSVSDRQRLLCILFPSAFLSVFFISVAFQKRKQSYIIHSLSQVSLVLYSSAMSKSTLADVLLTFLLVLEAETTSPSREGVAMRSANVISESGQDLLWSFMARSLVHCHLLCVGNDRCDGFTFARMSPTTQGWCQGWCRNPWQETSGSAVAGAVSYAIKSRQFDLQQTATTQGQGFDLQDASTTQGQEFDTQETSTATQGT